MSPFDSDFPIEANPSSIFFSKNHRPGSYFEATIPDPQRFHPSDAFGLADLVENRDHSRVLFGSKLRVQIPAADFGTKTVRYPGYGQGQLSPCVQTKALNVSETEDYTRVISHGPNPRITHIFDNAVYVEEKKKAESFLSNCYTCKKNLDQKQDIYVYRGEKGFCSSHCRFQEMLLDQMET